MLAYTKLIYFNIILGFFSICYLVVKDLKVFNIMNYALKALCVESEV